MDELEKTRINTESSEQESEFNLADIWNIIRRRYLLILIITIACILGSFLFSSKQAPYYRSTSTLLVQGPSSGTNNNMYSDYWYSERWAMTYAEMFKGDPVLEETKNRIVYPPLSVGQIRGALSVEVVENTLLMRITATFDDPKVAKKIVDTVGVVFIEKISEMYKSSVQESSSKLQAQIKDLEEKIEIATAELDSTSLTKEEKAVIQEDLKFKWEYKASLDKQLQDQIYYEMQMSPAIKIYQDGNLPVYPITTKKTMTQLMATALGLFLGFLVAFLLEYFDDTIKTEEDLKKAIHGRILGIIPHFDSKMENYYYSRYAYRSLKKAPED